MNPATVIISALVDIQNWTWRGILGALLVVAAYVVPRLVAIAAGVGDVLDFGNLVGLGLIAAEVARARAQMPPPPPVKFDGTRGFSTLRILGTLIAVGLAAWLIVSASGCATMPPEQSGETLRVQHEPADESGGCKYRTDIDGRVLFLGYLRVCPASPACEVRP
jgi:hypothetical protein